MGKSLCQRARDIRGGILESRIVSRMETKGRELTDDETISELEYLKDTFRYAGYDEEYTKEVLQAINYLLRRYAK